MHVVTFRRFVNACVIPSLNELLDGERERRFNANRLGCVSLRTMALLSRQRRCEFRADAARVRRGSLTHRFGSSNEDRWMHSQSSLLRAAGTGDKH